MSLRCLLSPSVYSTRRPWIPVVCTAALLALASCDSIPKLGNKYAASKDASESYESYRVAFASHDFGAVYDLFSTETKRRFDRALKRGDEDMLHGLDREELLQIPARDACVRIFSAMLERTPEEFDDAARATVIPPPLILGEYRTFRRQHPSGSESQIRLYRENGIWLLDIPFSAPGVQGS